MAAQSDFHESLDRELKRPGRSQSALARHLGVDPSAVNRMVAGTRTVKLDEYTLILDYLMKTGGREEDLPVLSRDALPKADAALLSVFPDIARLIKPKVGDLTGVLKGLAARREDYAMVCTAAREIETILQPMPSVARRTIGGMADVMTKMSNTVPAITVAFEIVALRDAFVQSSMPLSFDMPEVRDMVTEIIAKLDIDNVTARAAADPRLAFAVAVLVTAQLLEMEDPAK